MSAKYELQAATAGGQAAHGHAPVAAMPFDASNGFPTADSIDRRSGLSPREFLHEYALPCRPVIVSDATAHMPAMKLFTFDFFRERYGHITREVAGRKYTIAEQIERVMASTEENPAPYPYNLDMEVYFPELVQYVKPDVVYGKLDRLNHPLLPRVFLKSTIPYEIFLGGRGDFFPRVHYDALWMNTQITQIKGSKQFFMYPYEQGRFLYPHPENEKMSQVDFATPDLQRFPLFANAKPIVVTVQEGETIFFPAGWWHATRIHEPCISFGRAQLNQTNYRKYAADSNRFWRRFHPRVAPLFDVYVRSVGRVMDFQENRL
jgi:histone arginine demethylase JMJD6